MNGRTLSLILLLGAVFAGEALACAVCSGAPESTSSQNMAVAIWFLLGAVMAVLGGVGLFGVHLWRHSRTPLEPHQELTQEDLAKYE